MNFVEKTPENPPSHSENSLKPARTVPAWRDPLSLGPGIALSGGIAAVAMALHAVPGPAAVSPMVLAFVIGIAASALFGIPPSTRPGVRFTAKSLLRIGVALLGLQLTVYQLADLGIATLIIVISVLIASFLFTKWVGRVLGVDAALTELLAAGTSICGASAVIATNAVTRAPDQDVGYAVASVSLFGTLSMVIYPLLFGVLHLDVRSYGLWAGASIHEVAQVVAAAFQVDLISGKVAVPVKLARVASLAPLVLILGALRFRRQNNAGNGNLDSGNRDAPRFQCRQIFPLFMLGFVILVAINSVITIPTSWHGWIVQVTTFLLTMSLAAIGLETSVRDLQRKGLRPMLLTGIASLFIAVLSLALIEVFA